MMSEFQYEDYANDLVDRSLNTYYANLNPTTLADDIESLVNQKEYATLEALSYWKQRLSQNVVDKIKWYGETIQINVDKEWRDITSVLVADLNYRQRLRFLENSLEKYSDKQPLFDLDSDLLTHTVSKNELIPSTLFQRNDLMPNVVRFANGKYAYIDESLEPPILHNLEKRGLTYYVRINPNYLYDNPSMLHKREAWRAPSPQWQNAIGIKRYREDGFSYYIPDDIKLEDNSRKYFERNTLGIFQLEGFYERKGDGYFEMMVEELKEEKHPFLEKEYYIIGRIIHLDSIEDGGKGFNAKLKHIDLAINLYKEDAAISRKEKRLVNRSAKVKAYPRSHILKLYDAQLSDLKTFSSFFESKYLQDEWINAMFVSNTLTKS